MSSNENKPFDTTKYPHLNAAYADRFTAEAEAWEQNADFDGLDRQSWQGAEEEARDIQKLYRMVELTDITAIGRWQDASNETGTGIKVEGFEGNEPDGSVHAFDITMDTTGHRDHLKLVSPFGRLALDGHTFSRLSLVRLPEKSKR